MVIGTLNGRQRKTYTIHMNLFCFIFPFLQTHSFFWGRHTNALCINYNTVMISELNTAVKGRNPTKIQKWLERARKSSYREHLQADIKQAEAMSGTLEKRKGKRAAKSFHFYRIIFFVCVFLMTSQFQNILASMIIDYITRLISVTDL